MRTFITKSSVTLLGPMHPIDCRSRASVPSLLKWLAMTISLYAEAVISEKAAESHNDVLVRLANCASLETSKTAIRMDDMQCFLLSDNMR